jgi:8-amino-7-oxononanoate synthase
MKSPHSLRTILDKRRDAGLYRRRRVSEGPQQPEMIIDGNPVVSFCSNDYLGLANHPNVIEALKRGAEQYGVGSGAAHLINGHCLAHHALEEELAEFTGRARALLFSTGYMANLGVAMALVKRGDSVFEDRLNHASLLDAGRLCGARFLRYRHADPTDLREKLTDRAIGAKLILTDGVFSMDGDLAPVPELSRLARQHDAWLMVDDAHGLGVLGDSGGGTLEYYALSANDVPILMGTLGKAIGTFGAFVAGDEDIIETFIQVARTYIYTTAIPPAIAEAIRTSLRIVKEETWRRKYLATLIQRFRDHARQLNLPLMESVTPIQPILLGDTKRAVKLSDTLLERGLLITAIRPPTVPDHTARLRITLSASHTEEQVDRLLDTLAKLSIDWPPSN